MPSHRSSRLPTRRTRMKRGVTDSTTGAKGAKTMRMIDAEAMAERILAAKEKADDPAFRAVFAAMLKALAAEPTVEKAVVPVRCEECRDYKGGYCVGFGPEGYCSDGTPNEGRGRRRC